MSEVEIVKLVKLLRYHGHTHGVNLGYHMAILDDAADLIESIRAQLAESRAREQAAVVDLGLIRGNNAPCLICEFNDMIGCCHKNHCFDDNDFFKWRGLREEK